MYRRMKSLTWLADFRSNVKSFPAGAAQPEKLKTTAAMRCTLPSWVNGVLRPSHCMALAAK
jgi:hypothetical protein